MHPSISRSFASCLLDGKILDYYVGTFESVYVSLNPFIKPIAINKAEFKPDTYPSCANIVTNCKPVAWSEVAQLAELPSLAAVDIGLRTRIGGLKKELQNHSYAAAIDALSDTQCILPPPEGCFSDLLHDKILQSIQGLGYDWLWIGDEFCTEENCIGLTILMQVLRLYATRSTQDDKLCTTRHLNPRPRRLQPSVTLIDYENSDNSTIQA
jgi:hypothetical protein